MLVVLIHIIRVFREVPPTSAPPGTEVSLDKNFFGQFLQMLIFEITGSLIDCGILRGKISREFSGIWAFRLFSAGNFLSGERLFRGLQFGAQWV